VSDPKEDDTGPTIEVVEKKPRPPGSMPEIKVGYAPAGRATLEAIAAELAPAAQRVFVQQNSSPEISVRESFAERDTLAAILEEANSPSPAEAPAPSDRTPASSAEDADSLAITTVRKAPVASGTQQAAVEIFEMLTFVLRGAEAAHLSSEALRRRFVEERLLKRLPVASMAEVDRVDVAPWTVQGTLVLRVWCRTA
jgi:hypothetical protein